MQMWACGAQLAKIERTFCTSGDCVQQLTNLAKGCASGRLMCNIIKWPKLWAFVVVPNFSNKVPSSARVGWGAQLPQTVKVAHVVACVRSTTTIGTISRT